MFGMYFFSQNNCKYAIVSVCSSSTHADSYILGWGLLSSLLLNFPNSKLVNLFSLVFTKLHLKTQADIIAVYVTFITDINYKESIMETVVVHFTFA